MFNNILLLLLSAYFCSCATLYSGQDLQRIEQKSIPSISKSVSFRFYSLTKNNYGAEEGFFLNRSKWMSEANVKHISSLKVFSDVKEIPFPYEYVSIKDESAFQKILKDSIPKIETDYFVDVRVTVPFNPHGGGMGMWGGLISAVTLGIIPAWWTADYDYEYVIYKDGKELGRKEAKEHYHVFHSTLFHLVPSSELMYQKDINRIDKNSMNTIVQNVIQQIDMDK